MALTNVTADAALSVASKTDEVVAADQTMRTDDSVYPKKERKKIRENNGASRTREARSRDLILIDEFLCFEMKQAPLRNTLRVSKFFS